MKEAADEIERLQSQLDLCQKGFDAARTNVESLVDRCTQLETRLHNAKRLAVIIDSWINHNNSKADEAVTELLESLEGTAVEDIALPDKESVAILECLQEWKEIARNADARLNRIQSICKAYTPDHAIPYILLTIARAVEDLEQDGQCQNCRGMGYLDASEHIPCPACNGRSVENLVTDAGKAIKGAASILDAVDSERNGQ